MSSSVTAPRHRQRGQVAHGRRPSSRSRVSGAGHAGQVLEAVAAGRPDVLGHAVVVVAADGVVGVLGAPSRRTGPAPGRNRPGRPGTGRRRAARRWPARAGQLAWMSATRRMRMIRPGREFTGCSSVIASAWEPFGPGGRGRRCAGRALGASTPFPLGRLRSGMSPALVRSLPPARAARTSRSLSPAGSTA